MGSVAHWENVFSQKKQNEVSWYQSVPKTSIEFIEMSNIPKTANVIDIGSGNSYFIDYLVDQGYENIYALDISQQALERLQQRLGDRASKVNWIVVDVIDFKPKVKFDYWHDRAAFHFLSDRKDIDKYIQLTSNYIANGGKMMVGTFSDNGPLKCSGLNITQYSKEALAELFSIYFRKIKCIEEKHSTPFETFQNFTFCSFLKGSNNE